MKSDNKLKINIYRSLWRDEINIFDDMIIQSKVNSYVNIPKELMYIWSYIWKYTSSPYTDKKNTDNLPNVIEQVYDAPVYSLYSLPYRLINAIQEECGEMLADSGYIWWKVKPIDYENLILEIVDIYHFVLSYGILLNVYADYITDKKLGKYIFDELIYSGMPKFQRLKSKLFINKIKDEDLMYPYIGFLNTYHNKFNEVILYTRLMNEKYKNIPLLYSDPTKNIKLFGLDYIESLFRKLDTDFIIYLLPDASSNLTLTMEDNLGIYIEKCIKHLDKATYYLYNMGFKQWMYPKSVLIGEMNIELNKAILYLALAISLIAEAIPNVRNNLIVSKIYFMDRYKTSKEGKEKVLHGYKLMRYYYIGKTTLNIFRYNNGYNEGKYIKTWKDSSGAEKEDNYFLFRILTSIVNEYNIDRLSYNDIFTIIYGELENYYKDLR